MSGSGAALTSQKDDSKDEKGETDSKKDALPDDPERNEGNPDDHEGSADVLWCHTELYITEEAASSVR